MARELLSELFKLNGQYGHMRPLTFTATIENITLEERVHREPARGRNKKDGDRVVVRRLSNLLVLDDVRDEQNQAIADDPERRHVYMYVDGNPLAMGYNIGDRIEFKARVHRYKHSNGDVDYGLGGMMNVHKIYPAPPKTIKESIA